MFADQGHYRLPQPKRLSSFNLYWQSTQHLDEFFDAIPRDALLTLCQRQNIRNLERP
jgi:hypothetical protein